MKFMFELDEQDLRVLNLSLVEMPYKVVAQLIAKINAQIAEQTKERQHDDNQHKP